MEHLVVTCPETGEQEQIGCLVARDGEPLVVLRCTRFDPPEALMCSATCIRRPMGCHGRDAWQLPSCASTR